jgi:predicted RNA-binding protein with PIN domain
MERRPRGFFRGVIETLAIVGGFVAFGIAAGSLTGPPAGAPRGAAGDVPYLVSPMDPSQGALPEPRVWLVDGFNALHVALLAGRDRSRFWMRDARESLLARVRGFDDPSAEVWVVFDGPHPAPEPADVPPGGLRVAFARSADEWLLRRLRDAEPGAVAVVTADRPLADKARARGARVVSPHAFLARCAAPAGSET